MTTTRERFRFFHDHAGYVVGESAIGAIALARAEELLERAIDLGVARVEWVDDDEPYDYNPRGRGFEDADAEDAARRFDSNEWTGPFGCVVDIAGETGASLWGIVVGPRGTNDPYCRVVAAELASEIEDDLRQAIGDALDAETGVCA
jgi:hypothetical protein